MPPPCPSPCPIVLPHTPGAFCHGDLTPQRGQARLQPPWSPRWSRAGSTGRGSCFPGDVSEGCIVSGRGRSGAARQRMSLHCPPCSARAIFKLGGSSWPFCGPPALLCGMPQLSVASLASLSLSGAAEGHFGAWRGGEAKAVRSPAPCALLGLSPRELSPAPSPRPRSWRGWELPAGELEIERFLRHQRLPKANNRGCWLLSLPAADS